MIRYKTPIKIVVPLQQFLWNKLYFKHNTGLTMMELWKTEIQNESPSWKKPHQVIYSSYLTKASFLFSRLGWIEQNSHESTWHTKPLLLSQLSSLHFPSDFLMKTQSVWRGGEEAQPLQKAMRRGWPEALVLLLKRGEELIEHLCN